MARMNSDAEKIAILLHSIDDSTGMAGVLKAKAAEVATPAAYRTEVFITPGGEYGDVTMLFSSVVNAAHFLWKKSSLQWTLGKPGNDYQQMTRHRELIRRLCQDEDYCEGWWFARDTQNPDGTNEFIDNMKDYSIIDMRAYDYRKS